MTECSICLIPEIIEQEKVTNDCGHSFCKPCLDSWFARGRDTCPLCVQKISYFDYNQEKYRLIKIKDTNENNQNTYYYNHIILDNKSCYIIKFISFVVIGLTIFQTYMIHKLNNKNQHLKDMYNAELNKYIDYINENQLIDIDTQEELFVYQSNISDYVKCWIPKYFLDICFN